jgi:hypothetical protein
MNVKVAIEDLSTSWIQPGPILHKHFPLRLEDQTPDSGGPARFGPSQDRSPNLGYQHPQERSEVGREKHMGPVFPDRQDRETESEQDATGACRQERSSEEKQRCHRQK